MAALKINTDKIANLNQLDFTENRTICDQSNNDGTSLKLVLQRRFKNGNQRIFMVGFAFRDGELVNYSDIGTHMPDKCGVNTIVSVCNSYDYSGMYELITH